MELEFESAAISCIKPLLQEVQAQELTQEVKLPESMPDIGRVAGSIGQVLLRSKQWENGQLTVSGACQAVVLYQPEEAEGIRKCECWMPFSLKWSLPPSDTDGSACVQALLRSLDARSASSRRLVVRANIALVAQVTAPARETLYAPPEALPPQLQLLRRSYPVCLPRETGEKAFTLEERLDLPANTPLHKVLACRLQPELLDQRVMAGKAVFRGMALLQVLGCDGEGRLQVYPFELPFSQYAQLEEQYDQDAEALVTLALTALEVEKTPDGLQLKADLLGQYTVYDRPALSLVSDAYSNDRQVHTRAQPLLLPAVLDRRSQSVTAQAQLTGAARQVLDAVFLPDAPRVRTAGETAAVELAGTFWVLYIREDGALEQGSVRWQGEHAVAADPGCRLWAVVTTAGLPQAAPMGDTVHLRADLQLQLQCTAQQALDMVTGLELGPLQPKDPTRPCLILRRVGDQPLWDLAKESRSTVEAIMQANQLTQEPQAGQMLLIPVC